MMSVRCIDFQFAVPGQPLRPADEGLLLDYIVGSNGVFARGRRPGLEVCMPVSFNLQPVRGLAEVASYVQWGWPKVPTRLLAIMLELSREVCRRAVGEREALFHLSFDPAGSTVLYPDSKAYSLGWHVEFPEQDAGEQHVRPLHTGAGSSTERAIIELHSHHNMPAEFSPTDNEDESQGFRIYAVIGNIFGGPEIRARVGLFGHFFEFSASEFFELPEGLRDCVSA